MMFNLNEYMKANRGAFHVKRIECKDGFSMSVQGHRGAYSNPRRELQEGEEYDAVEVGFPSAMPELIMEYCESPDKPTETVYGYVPVNLVEQLVDLHGGVA
jgi:hypothetical protein